MKRVIWIASWVALAASCDAYAVGTLADVTLIDRDSGAQLNPYYHHGEYWVAGRPGARYAIEIHNRTAERLLAVTSVDGINVISGASAGWEQGGYVFDPLQAYQITGWRKSNEEVAAFTFTDSPNSYAERTGRPANVGVIGVALFREKPARAYLPPKIAVPDEPPSGARDDSRNAAAQAAAPAASGGAERAQLQREIAASARAAVPKLGTGHGEREYSYVVDTDFRRLREEPSEVVRIRYDSLENLVAMGIVRRPHPVPAVPNPFPDSQSRRFVPDPPG